MSIEALLIKVVSLVLTFLALQEGQNHMLLDDKVSGLRCFSKDDSIDLVTGRETISCFSSLREVQKHLLQVIVILKVLEMRSFAATDVPFNSLKTCCKTSAASYCKLKSKGTSWALDIVLLSAHKKFDGSIGLTDLSFNAMLSDIAFESGDKILHSAGVVFQRGGKTLKACKMALALHLFPLFMKPMGKFTLLVFEIGFTTRPFSC